MTANYLSAGPLSAKLVAWMDGFRVCRFPSPSEDRGYLDLGIFGKENAR